MLFSAHTWLLRLTSRSFSLEKSLDIEHISIHTEINLLMHYMGRKPNRSPWADALITSPHPKSTGCHWFIISPLAHAAIFLGQDHEHSNIRVLWWAVSLVSCCTLWVTGSHWPAWGPPPMTVNMSTSNGIICQWICVLRVVDANIYIYISIYKHTIIYIFINICVNINK